MGCSNSSETTTKEPKKKGGDHDHSVQDTMLSRDENLLADASQRNRKNNKVTPTKEKESVAAITLAPAATRNFDKPVPQPSPVEPPHQVHVEQPSPISR